MVNGLPDEKIAQNPRLGSHSVRLWVCGLLLVSLFGAVQHLSAAPTKSATPSLLRPPALAPPVLATLLKPAWLKRIIDDKEIIVNASLKDNAGSPLRTYSIYAAMRVGATLDLARQVLTNYQLYSEIIPYVDRTVYNSKQQILWIEGGIWGFRLSSQIRFQEMTERWIHFQIIGGHFTSLAGDMIFEDLGEKGTLVYLRGEQSGTDWPPKFVIERGAEVVFGFTAGRMRSYIESQKKSLRGAGNGREIRNGNQGREGQGGNEAGKKSETKKGGDPVPEPRSHL